MQKSIILILAIVLLGCEKNEFTVPVPVGGGGSGGYSAPSRSVPRSSPKTAPTRMPSYTFDPDDPNSQPEIWDESVVAASEEKARQECQRRAASYGVKLKRVQVPSRVRQGQNQVYRCWYESNSIE